MRKIPLAVLFTAVLCLGATDLPKHLADANTLVDNISAANNVYEHKGCFIKWKGEDGATQYENRSDCSDFLALLVQHSYGITTKQLKDWTGHTRPLADHWHDAIVAGHGFKQIKKLSDALPGDVMAVKFPPGLGDTGHVMLIAELPTQINEKAPIVPGTTQWKITIIDSSKSGHGPTDTRKQPDGTFATGVGRGVFRLYTNPAGEIAGYSWSESSKSKFEPQTERDLVIGRLEIAK
jgi:hypothetical protein